MNRQDLWLLVPAPLRRLPADLAAVTIWTLLTNATVFVPVVAETPARILFGLGFVLFVPGYVLVAALFPETGTTSTQGDSGQTELTAAGGIDGIERVALSFGLSIAVVPLVGLVLNFTPFGIRLVPIVLATSGLTLGLTAIAGKRRQALPEDERFTVPYRAWLEATRGEILEPDTRTDAILNVLLVVSVVLALGSVGFAVAVPDTGESFSEFYLLTETAEGEMVADEYPTEFTLGNARELVVGIGNQEHQRMEYTVVSQLQRVQIVNNSTEVLERASLDRFSATLAHNESWQRPHNVTAPFTGQRLRLQYLLYRGEQPQQLTTATAYRETHLWVNVTTN